MYSTEQLTAITEAVKEVLSHPSDAEANVAPVERMLTIMQPFLTGKEYTPAKDPGVYDAIRVYYVAQDKWPASNIEDVDFLASLDPEAMPGIVMRVMLCKHKAVFVAKKVKVGYDEYAGAYTQIIIDSPHGLFS